MSNHSEHRHRVNAKKARDRKPTAVKKRWKFLPAAVIAVITAAAAVILFNVFFVTETELQITALVQDVRLVQIQKKLSWHQSGRYFGSNRVTIEMPDMYRITAYSDDFGVFDFETRHYWGAKTPVLIECTAVTYLKTTKIKKVHRIQAAAAADSHKAKIRENSNK